MASSKHDVLQVQAALLADELLLKGKTLRAACEALGISDMKAYRLMRTEEYEQARQQILAGLHQSRGEFLDNWATQLNLIAPQAVDRIRQIVAGSVNEMAQLRAIENVLDRVGLGRQRRQEVRQTIALDKESIERLRGAEAVLE